VKIYEDGVYMSMTAKSFKLAENEKDLPHDQCLLLRTNTLNFKKDSKQIKAKRKRL
jgi:hypothetical protein